MALARPTIVILIDVRQYMADVVLMIFSLVSDHSPSTKKGFKVTDSTDSETEETSDMIGS
jgi:hypothetical protein